MRSENPIKMLLNLPRMMQFADELKNLYAKAKASLKTSWESGFPAADRMEILMRILDQVFLAIFYKTNKEIFENNIIRLKSLTL